MNSNYPPGVTDATIERYFGEGYEESELSILRWECPFCWTVLKGTKEERDFVQLQHDKKCPERNP